MGALKDAPSTSQLARLHLVSCVSGIWTDISFLSLQVSSSSSACTRAAAGDAQVPRLVEREGASFS